MADRRQPRTAGVHDVDPDGEMSFHQPDQEKTFSEFANVLSHVHPGAAAVGLTSLVLLIAVGIWQFAVPAEASGFFRFGRSNGVHARQSGAGTGGAAEMLPPAGMTAVACGAQTATTAAAPCGSTTP